MNFAAGQEKYIFIIKKLSSLFLFIFKVGRGEAVTLYQHKDAGAVSDLIKTLPASHFTIKTNKVSGI